MGTDGLSNNGPSGQDNLSPSSKTYDAIAAASVAIVIFVLVFLNSWWTRNQRQRETDPILPTASQEFTITTPNVQSPGRLRMIWTAYVSTLRNRGLSTDKCRAQNQKWADNRASWPRPSSPLWTGTPLSHALLSQLTLIDANWTLRIVNYASVCDGKCLCLTPGGLHPNIVLIDSLARQLRLGWWSYEGKANVLFVNKNGNARLITITPVDDGLGGDVLRAAVLANEQS